MRFYYYDRCFSGELQGRPSCYRYSLYVAHVQPTHTYDQQEKQTHAHKATALIPRRIFPLATQPLPLRDTANGQ